jgi:hypothetical protein
MMHFKRYRLIVPGIAVCVLSFAVYTFSNRPPSIYWEKDARVMYAFSARTNVVTSGGSVANTGMKYGSVDIKGILNFRVFDSAGKKIKAGIQFSRVQITHGQMRDGQNKSRSQVVKDARDRQTEDMFSKLFYVWFSSDGRLLNFAFPNDIAVDDRKSIEDLIRTLQIVVPRPIFKSWNTEETDKYGTYSSAYHFGKNLVKQKNEYRDISDRTSLKNYIQSIAVKKSIGNCEYGYPDTWLKNLDSDELTVFYNNNDAVMKLSATADLKKIPYNPDANLRLWKDDLNPDSDISQWESKPVERFSVSEKKELDAVKKYYGSTDFKQIMDGLFKKYRTFNTQCIGEILNYLKIFPEAASDIPDFLLKGLNAGQMAMLVNALQRDKSEYSQKALVRIIKGKEFPPDTRIQSAVAAGDITRPDDGFIKSLIDMYDGRNNREELTVKLSDNAMLSMGRITRNLSNSKSAADTNIVNEIKGKIKTGFSTAKDPGQITTMIYAAANTGDKSYIDPITHCFQSQESSVRAAAARSLPLFNDKKIDSILTDQLDTENNVNVKTAIVKSLYDLNASDKAVETVCEKVQSEENEMVRGDMYRFLAKNRNRSGVREVLEKMLTSDNTMENRNIISRALFSNK